jgi:cyclase
MSTAHVHDREHLPPPVVEEVAERVFAYLQPDGSWGLNNTGFVVGRDAVTAVDTCFTETRTRAFLTAVAGVTDRPVRTLLNTHHHGDHTHGNNQLPGATIVGHDECRRLMLEGGSVAALFPGVEWGDISVAPPFVTFTDRLNLYADDLLMEAVFVGPAHTTNDVILWLPEQRLLFSGDLVFNGGTPFVMMGTVAGSLTAIERLRSLGAETIVPGHGPVCGPELLDDQEQYLRFVQDVARDAFEAGVTPLEAAQGTDLGRFAAWHDRERLAGNLHRAYSELRGEPLGVELDLLPIVTDMIAFNDGKPLRCLA